MLIALRYEKGMDLAPVVVAKGENLLARRIKVLAAEHEVPTIENKPVARALFALGKVGDTNSAWNFIRWLRKFWHRSIQDSCLLLPPC